MSKFEKPFAELKFYLPLEDEVWQDFRESKLYAHLMQAGLFHVHNSGKPKPKPDKTKAASD